MRAIICNKFGTFEELKFSTLPDPIPGPGQVVIRNTAIGVNYPDGLLVQGLYQCKPTFPFVPGIESVGEVIALGEGVDSCRKGDKVAAVLQIGQDAGSYAEQVVTSSKQLIHLGAKVNDADGCALICAYSTAHHALKQRARLQPGETLAVLGASGATGLAAVEIGKVMGAQVLAFASTPEKLALAKDHGADQAVSYLEHDLCESLKKLTSGQGVDVVFDPVGGDSFDACSRSMAWNGRLLVIGFASGRIPKFPTNLALVKGFSVVGVFWGSFVRQQPHIYRENMAELLGWYRTGKVRPHIAATMPLSDAPKALAQVFGRKSMGKIILDPR
ncbi:MAG: NADPH:quinone oxidoreductase family protein [Deltaproteobacteria bacterium]|nr:NADPH:quinone oxidoreductase family protein [Deltaproteobacteria bacterium]